MDVEMKGDPPPYSPYPQQETSQSYNPPPQNPQYQPQQYPQGPPPPQQQQQQQQYQPPQGPPPPQNYGQNPPNYPPNQPQNYYPPPQQNYPQGQYPQQYPQGPPPQQNYGQNYPPNYVQQQPQQNPQIIMQNPNPQIIVQNPAPVVVIKESRHRNRYYYRGRRGGRRGCVITRGCVAGVSIFFCCFIALAIGLSVGLNSSKSKDVEVKKLSLNIQVPETLEDWFDKMVNGFNGEKVLLSSGEQVVISYTTSLNSVYDTNQRADIWIPASQYWAEQSTNIDTSSCQPLTNIPLGIVTWRDLAVELGWPNSNLGWDNILEFARNDQALSDLGFPDEKFGYAHGHPMYSDSGKLSMLGEIYAFNNLSASTQLNAAIISSPTNHQAIRDVENVVYHLGESDEDLLDKMFERGSVYLHAVASYESSVIKFNQKPLVNSPFVFIYPSEGTYWLDHPYCNTKYLSASKVEAADEFFKYLTNDDSLKEMVKNGIRPALPTSLNSPTSPFIKQNGVDPSVIPSSLPLLPYPSKTNMDLVMNMWQQDKKKVRVALMLEISGTLASTYQNATKKAAIQFIETLQPDDSIYVYQYSNTITLLPANGLISTVKSQVINSIQGLTSTTGRSFYDAVVTGYNKMNETKAQDIDLGVSKNYIVIVLTVGKDLDSTSYTYNSMLSSLGDPTPDSPHIFTIGVNSPPNWNELQQIAIKTNGKSYNPRMNQQDDAFDQISKEF